MARNSRKSSSSKSGGSTLFGVLAGLIIGLAAAAGVAIFVTNAPMPFVDKASRDPAKTLLPDVRDAPDPNLALYGKDGAAGLTPSGPINTVPTPAPLPEGATPAQAPGASMTDDINALIATLGNDSKTVAAKPAAPASTTSAPAKAAPHAAASRPAPSVTPVPESKTSPANAQTTYYLQAGAFRSEKDAEAVKAQILLIGLPAQVQKAQINGSTLNRVRVGPFKGIDEMNRSRARLGEEKIASSVVRQ